MISDLLKKKIKIQKMILKRLTKNYDAPVGDHFTPASGKNGASTLSQLVEEKKEQKKEEVQAALENKGISPRLAAQINDNDESSFKKRQLDPTLGVTITHEPHFKPKHILVRAKDKEGKQIGHAVVDVSGHKYAESKDVEVKPEHRRKGVASAMYHHVELKTGKQMRPSRDRTTDGKKLWSGNRASGNKQFGKTTVATPKVMEAIHTREATDKRIHTPPQPARSVKILKSAKDFKPAETIYISGDGDGIGATVEQKVLDNDLNGIIKQSKKIKYGQKYIREAFESHGGKMLVHGGDDNLAMMSADKMDEIENIRQGYKKKTGFTITFGVGNTMRDAVKAMVYGKLTGKNKTIYWTPDLDKKLKEISHEETPKEKYKEHGMIKCVPQKPTSEKPKQ